MALTAGYGVLVGTITDYYRDPPDNYGRYYHGNIKISTSTGVYHCAVDVDSKKSNVGVEWRTLGLLPGDLSSVVSLGVGWHALASAATSGAMDYVRSPMLAARIGCLRLI